MCPQSYVVRGFTQNWMFLEFPNFWFSFKDFSVLAHTPGYVVCCQSSASPPSKVMIRFSSLEGANFSSRLPPPTSTGTNLSTYFHTSTPHHQWCDSKPHHQHAPHHQQTTPYKKKPPHFPMESLRARSSSVPASMLLTTLFETQNVYHINWLL